MSYQKWGRACELVTSQLLPIYAAPQVDEAIWYHLAALCGCNTWAATMFVYHLGHFRLTGYADIQA
jgi:hypothetical protein